MFSLKGMKMKDERFYHNYHGEIINSRVVKGLPLAEAVYAIATAVSALFFRAGTQNLTVRRCSNVSPLL